MNTANKDNAKKNGAESGSVNKVGETVSWNHPDIVNIRWYIFLKDITDYATISKAS